MRAGNRGALIQVFARELGLPETEITASLAYNQAPQWDSLAHMGLVAALEERFDIMLDTSDIIDMSSLAKAEEILSRHGVIFEPGA